VLPFLLAGIVIGSLYALSGVGMLVLYRTTGVLNFGYGALGAAAAMLAWQCIESLLQPVLAFVLGVVGAAALSLLFGVIAGPFLARTTQLAKATATLGLALILLGLQWFLWNDKARTLTLPTDLTGFPVAGAYITLTQLICLAIVLLTVLGTSVFLRYTGTGVAMRALASDRDLTSMLGVGVRRIELLAWTVSGALAGVSGLLLASQTQLEPGFLTFLVIPALSSVVIGRFRSLVGTLVGGVAIGVVQSFASYIPATSSFSDAAPFIVAVLVIVYLQRRKVVSIEVAR
jgi:branched-chain amino acid transport system permease protein